MPELTLRLDYEDEFIPAVSPLGGAPNRSTPTTQVLVTVEEWPGNVFRLWAPENVGLLWHNWRNGGTRQDFSDADGGLTWRVEDESGWTVETSLRARRRADHRDARRQRIGRGSRTRTVQASARLRVRRFLTLDGEWVSLESARPGSDYPTCVRTVRVDGAATSATCSPVR